MKHEVDYCEMLGHKQLQTQLAVCGSASGCVRVTVVEIALTVPSVGRAAAYNSSVHIA